MDLKRKAYGLAAVGLVLLYLGADQVLTFGARSGESEYGFWHLDQFFIGAGLVIVATIALIVALTILRKGSQTRS